MPTATLLTETAVAAKQRLAVVREELRKHHDAGTPGIQVCTQLTDMFDAVVLEIFDAILDDLGQAARDQLRGEIALVPFGGYGRRDVAPFSDVDLMLLHSPRAAKAVEQLARELVKNLNDAGFDLGFAARQPAEACRLAMTDASILTSLAEARLLTGSVALFTQFAQSLRRKVRRNWRALVPMVEEARRDERRKYGETVYLLEPNVKRSRGCLRDIQLVRWIGYVRYGEVETTSLRRAGRLSQADWQVLRKAREFLLRIRNDMHFQAGKAQDVLDRGEQQRLAEKYGYERTETQLPVEAFMREYFTLTSEVRNISTNLLRGARPRTLQQRLVDPLWSHHMEGDFRVGPRRISATRRGLKKVTSDVAEVLRLMDLANQHNMRIEDRTWRAIREEMMQRDDIEPDDEAIERFLSLLTQPGKLYEMVRKLHELRVLEKLIPEFNHARALLQFNSYHKYTVDEHSLRAVAHCTDFQNDEGYLGRVYRTLRRPQTLHLALLLHDLGKGHIEDHSEVGARIAEATAQRFNLPERQAHNLRFLVLRHLALSELAFRGDTGDEQVIINFAREIGSWDLLKMLYLLTCADISAVGPGALNRWKLDVLTQLYRRLKRHLDGGDSIDSAEIVEQRQQDVNATLGELGSDPWYARQVAATSGEYLLNPPERIAEDLKRLRTLEPETAVAQGEYLEKRDVVEYTVGAYADNAPGLFHRLTGELSAKRLQILSAEITTLADGLVLDRFYVHDETFQGEPPPERIQEVADVLADAALDRDRPPPKFSEGWQAGNSAQRMLFQRLPTRVQVDNDSSERYSVVRVFAHDRRGLLYTIARTIYEQGLSVAVAKIGTHHDQVVDVFFVTDQQTGEPLKDEERMKAIEQRLLEAIDGPTS